MQVIANLIVPVIILIVIIYGLYKKINIYDVFMEGVMEGLKIVLNIFPSIFAMIVSINVLVKSQILIDLTKNINISLFPKEIIPLGILRPISASSSFMLLNDIIKTYGVDSFIGRLSSVMVSSTDTTIYIIGMYYSSVGIKKIKHSLIVGLMADFICVVISILVIKLL